MVLLHPPRAARGRDHQQRQHQHQHPVTRALAQNVARRLTTPPAGVYGRKPRNVVQACGLVYRLALARGGQGTDKG